MKTIILKFLRATKYRPRGFSYPEDGGDSSYEMSVYTRTTRRHIPENDIRHSHHRENLKSYIVKYTFQNLIATVHYIERS
jgi:hypothetical protein